MTQGKRTESEGQSALKAAADLAEAMVAAVPFSHRGFSNRTIDALIAHGIDLPERLLFVTEADLKSIPGIGEASFEEIVRYRTRLIPER
jgi:DNA-directed RNA polymerase alpha subunit